MAVYQLWHVDIDWDKKSIAYTSGIRESASIGIEVSGIRMSDDHARVGLVEDMSPFS